MFCRNNHVFVMTKMILVAVPTSDTGRDVWSYYVSEVCLTCNTCPLQLSLQEEHAVTEADILGTCHISYFAAHSQFLLLTRIGTLFSPSYEHCEFLGVGSNTTITPYNNSINNKTNQHSFIILK